MAGVVEAAVVTVAGEGAVEAAGEAGSVVVAAVAVTVAATAVVVAAIAIEAFEI